MRTKCFDHLEQGTVKIFKEGAPPFLKNGHQTPSPVSEISGARITASSPAIMATTTTIIAASNSRWLSPRNRKRSNR